jgi:3-oxoacyl-[acyl-carrier protein] reductase
VFDLTGKVALVTGGSRGIGRATALTLARQGAHVVVAYVTGQDAARQVVETIVGAGGTAEAVRIDMSEAAGAEGAVSEVAKRLGRLDVLVANAGISADALLLRLKDEDLLRILTVNVVGAIACARAAVKTMMRAKTGRIVFVSSVVGEMGNAGQTAYAASKAALLGAAKSIAREYASRGITVNAVTPGYIETDMTRALTEEQRAAMLSGVPLARPGSVDDVASAIAFLASNEASYITGQVIRVNGGMYM